MTFQIAGCCFALTLAVPVAAHAQKDAFIDAFITFPSALAGTYGDEGPTATSALERMASSLDVWERAASESETALTRRAGATPAEFALVYVDARRVDAALDAMKRAIAAEPTRAALHRFIGVLYDDAGRFDDALTSFRTAQQLDPVDPIAAYLLADALARRGDGGLEPLVLVLERAVGRNDPGRVSFNELRLLDDGSAKTPIFAPAAYADAFALMERGRYRDAVSAFRTVSARDPLLGDAAGRDAAVTRGIAALRARDGATAVAQLESAVSAHPGSSEAHRVSGVVYRAVGRLQDSIEHLTAAVRLAPSDERARVTLGGVLAEAGRTDEAIRVLRETIAVLPASGEARWALAQVLQAANRPSDAIDILEQAAALPVLAGKAPLYWRIAELAQAYRRDYVRVIATLSERVRLNRNDGDAHKNLGLAYLRAGRDEEALVELLMGLLLGVDDTETIAAMGQAYLSAGRLDRAEALLRRAVAREPSSAQVQYALGMTLQRLGRTEEARGPLAEFERLRTAAFDEQRREFERVR